MRTIDHIVYAVPNLAQAIAYFEALTGVRPVVGGFHQDQGTKNALVNLGNGCYLELIAADYINQAVTQNRWMGVDLIAEPMVTRWSLKSTNLAHDSKVLQAYHRSMGVVHQGQRQTTSGKTLSWQMTLPLAAPAVELVPFMTDWQASDFHPTDQLPEQCQLVALELRHPQPETVLPTLQALDVELEVMQAETVGIGLRLMGEKGEVRV